MQTVSKQHFASARRTVLCRGDRAYLVIASLAFVAVPGRAIAGWLLALFP